MIFDFFINTAHAQTGADPATGSSYSFLVIMGIFFVFFYFAMWRPQSKRAKEQRNLLDSLAKGDEVTTAGGLLGRISKVGDQYIVLNIANDTEVVVQKGSVVSALPKGTLKTIV